MYPVSTSGLLPAYSHFCLCVSIPLDPTLTLENIGPIMEVVENWRKVATSVFINIPAAIQERITQHHTTDKEQSCVAGEWWVYTDLYPSWDYLASALYHHGEYRALEKMAQYLPEGAYMERGYWCYIFISLVASVSLTENSWHVMYSLVPGPLVVVWGVRVWG